MATKRITDLTNVASAQDTDLFILETSSGTRSISKSNLGLVTDSEKSYWNAKAESGHTHADTMINPLFIELIPQTSATNGGYIDFHYGGSTADYTSRIIEHTSGVLSLQANVSVFDPPVSSSYARNISAGTTDLTAGSSSLATGAIYFVYE